MVQDSKSASRVRFVFLFVLVLATALIWYAVFYFEAHQNLVFTVFDIGQGDAIFFETPEGHQVLIDGGPSSAILAKLGETLPFWDRSIDVLILTHPHADHLDGMLEVLKRYAIGMVVESGVNYTLPEYREWHNFLKEKGVKIIIAKSGKRLRFSDDAYLDLLTPFKNFIDQSPKNVHDAMVVSLLHYGATKALLMGDAEKFVEYDLIFSGIDVRSDLLKVGHHGSKTSSSQDFLRAVSPHVALISVGKKNRYGHPHQEIIDRFLALGIATVRTDEEGDISFSSDGTHYQRVR